MNKITLFFISFIFAFSSCNKSAVAKPDTLIAEDQMIDMIYDLSLLDVLRIQNTYQTNKYPTPTEFIKEKYKVDSLTFAKNSQYYASNLRKYRDMYKEVQSRLDADLEKVGGKKKDSLPPPVEPIQ